MTSRAPRKSLTKKTKRKWNRNERVKCFEYVIFYPVKRTGYLEYIRFWIFEFCFEGEESRMVEKFSWIKILIGDILYFIGDYITCCIVCFFPINLDYVKIVTKIKLFEGNGFSGRFLTKESRGKMWEVVEEGRCKAMIYNASTTLMSRYSDDINVPWYACILSIFEPILRTTELLMNEDIIEISSSSFFFFSLFEVIHRSISVPCEHINVHLYTEHFTEYILYYFNIESTWYKYKYIMIYNECDKYKYVIIDNESMWQICNNS